MTAATAGRVSALNEGSGCSGNKELYGEGHDSAENLCCDAELSIYGCDFPTQVKGRRLLLGRNDRTQYLFKLLLLPSNKPDSRKRFWNVFIS